MEEADRFIIKQIAGNYMFELVSSNQKVLAISEMYSSLNGCKNGITAVKNNICGEIEDQTSISEKRHKNPKFELYIDKSGQYRYRLKAQNGEILIVSEGYKSKKSCIDNSFHVKNHAVKAETIVL